MATTSDTPAHLRHELHTPLSHIIGFSEMLLEEAEETGAAALVPRLRQVHGQAHDVLGRVDTVLSGADYAVRLAGELSPSVARLTELADALQAEAAQAGFARGGDIERIVAAARRLSALAAPPPAPAPPARAEAAEAPENGGRGTILVVDDNEGNREMLSRRLQRQGYAVLTAEDGGGALDLLRRRPVDLVLLDVIMPGMDGHEALKRIKADATLRHIPVLMISALDEMESVIGCIELGAEDFLPKPFNPVLLNARIGASIEKKRLRDREVRHAHALAELNRTLERRVQEQVAQLERLGRLKRFLSPQLAELIVEGGAEDPLKTHRREITVVFLDLRGFTAFAETAEPEEVMGILREFHAEMGKLVLAHEGTLERFTGDGMIVLFNDPVEVDNPAERAVRMALAMRDRVAGLCAAWKKRGFDLALGIGIAQGYATIGAIGFEERWDYSTIGTVTNLSARLCAEARGGQILAPQRVVSAVEDLVEAEDIGGLALKGLQRPVQAYNILRLRN